MYVTLNIGSASIRMLAIKGKRVRTWGEAPLEPGLAQDGLILHPNDVAAAINALFTSLKVNRRRVITSLSGLSFTYRTLNLPAMPHALQEEAVLRGAKKEIPVPLEELYLTWQKVGSSGDEVSYFVLGVPRNPIDSLVHTLREAGIRPYIMDLRALALTRAASRVNAILLSLEPDCFDIVVVANGRPATIHTAMPRGEGASIEDNMARVVDELSRTVGFYHSSHPERLLKPDTPLLLTGKLSTDHSVSQFIQAETEYPVEPLVPQMVLPPGFPVASYATNIGLAFKKTKGKTPSQKTTTEGEDARYHDINLNLLPERYRAESHQVLARRMLVPTLLAIAIGLIFPAYLVRNNAIAETERLETQIFTASEELRQIRLEADEAAQTEETIIQLSAVLDTLLQQQQKLAQADDAADNLQMVTDTIDQKGYLTAIEIDGDQVIVQGQAKTIADVIDYVTALERLDYFSEVRISEIDASGKGEPLEAGEEIETSFTVTMTR